MAEEIKRLAPEAVWGYFYDLTQISRPTGHMKHITDHPKTLSLCSVMTRCLLLALLILGVTVEGHAQSLYVKTFGKAGGVPLIFLHGGPGYNAAAFESVAAQALADNGFRVLVYDRRGEGRSLHTAARYTFDEALHDIDSLCRTYDLHRPVLLGHSFGGILALLYADKHPEQVRSVVLMSAPLALQASFDHIRNRCRAIYASRADSVNLRYMNMLDAMDKGSMEYASYCFMHAAGNGFYVPKARTKEGQSVYAAFEADSALFPLSKLSEWQAPQGFHRNEHYTTLDLTDTLGRILRRGTPVYGLYGADDGLYSAAQLDALRNLLGPDHMITLDSCSHNVFIDRRHAFIEALTRHCKTK